jgi:competence protein ComEA
MMAVAWLSVAPSVEAASPSAERKAAAADGKVNINTAEAAELMTLDGIGPKVAEKILEYRRLHGPFQRPEDLRKVQGVGRGLFERNRERIVVK